MKTSELLRKHPPQAESIRKHPPQTGSVEQHSLGYSIALHLLPGVAMVLFVVLAAPLVSAWGFPTVFALFVGIPLVIVPIELGYLLYQARHTTGTWSLASVVNYRERLSLPKYALWGFGLYAWFMVVLLASISLFDAWIARTFFSWLPESILQFSSSIEGGGDVSPVVLVVFFIVAFAFNGVIGPVVEELYFRGHLLPRIDRLGRWAPVLNAVLFTVYHFWTPWQIGRVFGVLPWVYTVWRTRSVYLSIIVHVASNMTFLLLFLAAVLATL
jgi:membrane protease YdiL (CAAX protease family)